MNYFSTPMPFNFEHIDELAKINDKVKESKVTSVYNGLPFNAEDICGFEHSRVEFKNVNNIDDLITYVKYSQDKGFEFIYLLNSLLFSTIDDTEITTRLEKLDVICEKLLKNNVKKLRITNPQLISYITNKFPEFEISTSTLMEQSELNHYTNLIAAFPKIKGVVPPKSASKNFTLLKNLKKRLPNLEIEMMLNEGCMQNCPFRIAHGVSLPRNNSDMKEVKLHDYHKVFSNNCKELFYSNFWLSFCKSNLIFPWEIKEYSKIGINNFKFAGRDSVKFQNGKYIKIYEAYMIGIEDPKYIEDMPIQLLSNYVLKFDPLKNYTVKKIKPYLPEIKYLIKNAHKCYSVCGSECTYCYQKAKKLTEKFPIETN